ncbi:MAG: hypothetical protein IJK97_00245, partial [Thermoguttaceae bacterium]|nr:hypothetical protein [Thermoguttaceae bacterium]
MQKGFLEVNYTTYHQNTQSLEVFILSILNGFFLLFFQPSQPILTRKLPNETGLPGSNFFIYN